MIYTQNIKNAIAFSIQVHEVDQKQKRKGKDIAYITHPLTVALILARAGASEEVIVAGLLHDAVEDCEPHGSVTREMVAEKFSEEVATLVASVTEENKELSWEERKREALAHIAHFSHGSVLVKSADILSNVTEILDDHARDGDAIFTRFNHGREAVIANYIAVAERLIEVWPESPLVVDLRVATEKLKAL